jgi:geranylgeranyl pyrophosphate synthase
MPLLALIKNKDKLSIEKVSKIYEIYVEEMIKISFGQAIDIVWHRGLAKYDKILEEKYLQMCIYKTGTLARMAGKIAATLADGNNDQIDKIGRFAESIGLAFQIQDDVLDLVGEEFSKQKGGFGKDITEGKITLMVIHTLKKAESVDKKRLTEIISMHTTDQKLRNEAIKIITKYGSIEYAKEFAKSIVNESWQEVNKILPPSEAKENLRAFANYLIERQS